MIQNRKNDLNVQRILNEKQEMFSQRYLTNFKFDPLVSQVYKQKELKDDMLENECLIRLNMNFNNSYYPLQKKQYLINRNGLINSDRMQKVEHVVQVGQNSDNDINIYTNDRSLSRCHFQIEYSRYFNNFNLTRTLKQIQFRMKKENINVQSSTLKRIFEFLKMKREIEVVGLDTIHGSFMKVENQRVQLIKDMIFMVGEEMMVLVKDIYKTDMEIDYSFIESRKNTLTNFELESTKNQKRKTNYIELQVIRGKPDRIMDENVVVNDLVLSEKCATNYFEPLSQCRCLVDNYFFIDIQTSFMVSFNQMIQEWQIMKYFRNENVRNDYGLWVNINLCKHNNQRYKTNSIRTDRSCKIKINTLEMELQI